MPDTASHVSTAVTTTPPSAPAPAAAVAVAIRTAKRSAGSPPSLMSSPLVSGSANWPLTLHDRSVTFPLPPTPPPVQQMATTPPPALTTPTTAAAVTTPPTSPFVVTVTPPASHGTALLRVPVSPVPAPAAAAAAAAVAGPASATGVTVDGNQLVTELLRLQSQNSAAEQRVATLESSVKQSQDNEATAQQTLHSYKEKAGRALRHRQTLIKKSVEFRNRAIERLSNLRNQIRVLTEQQSTSASTRSTNVSANALEAAAATAQLASLQAEAKELESNHLNRYIHALKSSASDTEERVLRVVAQKHDTERDRARLEMENHHLLNVLARVQREYVVSSSATGQHLIQSAAVASTAPTAPPAATNETPSTVPMIFASSPTSPADASAALLLTPLGVMSHYVSTADATPLPPQTRTPEPAELNVSTIGSDDRASVSSSNGSPSPPPSPPAEHAPKRRTPLRRNMQSAQQLNRSNSGGEVQSQSATDSKHSLSTATGESVQSTAITRRTVTAPAGRSVLSRVDGWLTAHSSACANAYQQTADREQRWADQLSVIRAQLAASENRVVELMGAIASEKVAARNRHRSGAALNAGGGGDVTTFVNELRNEYERALTLIDQLNQTKEKAENELNATQLELKGSQRVVAESESKLNTATAQYQALSTEHAELSNRHNELKAQVNSAESRVREHAQTVNDLRAEQTRERIESESAITQTRNELLSVQRVTEERRTELDACRTQLAAIERAVSEHRNTIAALQQSIAAKSTENQTLQTKIGEVSNALSAATQQLSRAAQTAALYEQRIQALSDSNSEHAQTIQTLRQQLIAERASGETVKHALSKAERELNAKSANESDLAVRLSAAERAQQVTAAHLETAQSQKREINLSLAATRTELNSQSAKLESARSEQRVAAERYAVESAAAIKELDAARAALRTAQATIETLKAEKADALRTRDAAVRERDSMKLELTAMHKQIMREAEANLVAQNCLLSENAQIAKLSELLTRSRNGISRLLELRRADEQKIKQLGGSPAGDESMIEGNVPSLIPSTPQPQVQVKPQPQPQPAGTGFGSPLELNFEITTTVDVGN